MQSRMSTAVNRDAHPIETGGGHLTDQYQITTRDPAFEVSFAMDGLHVVELEGEVEDVCGNRWSGRGTYQIEVARPLSLDTATLPGAPFESDDWFDAGVTVVGGSSCDVDVAVSLAGSDRELERWRISGRTNRFGVFQPGESIRLTEELQMPDQKPTLRRRATRK